MFLSLPMEMAKILTSTKALKGQAYKIDSGSGFGTILPIAERNVA